MSIASYSDLETAVASWMARSDLTVNIPDFITLAEAEFNRKLRVRQMLVTQATTPSSGQFSLPIDYLSFVDVTWTGSSNRELQYVHPSYFPEEFPTNPANIPCVFTVLGTTDNVGVVKIMPTDATVINFTYYSKITALSTSNTNWLLTAHPDLYLAGTLTESNVFVKDYDTAAVWKGRRDSLIDEITSLDQKTRAPSYIRTIGINP